MARVHRLVKSVNFHGAIVISSDCTKVRPCLSYSTDFGSHILGSVLPLEECEVDETEDIDEVIVDIKKKKATASQTRAIVAKVSLSNTDSQTPVNNFTDTTARDSSFGYCADSNKWQRHSGKYPRATHGASQDGSTP